MSNVRHPKESPMSTKSLQRTRSLGTLLLGTALVAMLSAILFFPSGSQESHLAWRLIKGWTIAAFAFGAWCVKRSSLEASTFHFSAESDFRPNLVVRVTFPFGTKSLEQFHKGPRDGFLAVDSSAYTARFKPTSQPSEVGPAETVELSVQLLSPGTALTALTVKTTVKVFLDGGPEGAAEVVSTERSDA